MRHDAKHIVLLIVGILLVTGSCTWAADSTMTPEQLTQWMRKRPLVQQIEITGNTALKDGHIRDLMETKTPGFFAKIGLREKNRIVRATLRRDSRAIERAYRRLGYWSASAELSARPGKNDDMASVNVLLNEGPRVYWGSVRVAGDNEELLDRLRRLAAGLERGKPADSLLFAVSRARMLSECADRGHPAAQITVTIIPRLDTLDLEFGLRAGPVVVFGEATVEGIKHTRDWVLMRELRIRPGDRYSQKRLDERQQDVYATGLFTFVRLEPFYADSVRSDPARSDSIRTADLRLRVVERPPSFIGFRTGAGQEEDRDLTWDYAVEWGSRNWFGTGRRWTLTAQSEFVVVTDWRVLSHRFSARFVQPWILGMRLPTSIELAYEPPVFKTIENYRRESLSGELNISRRFRRVYRAWSSLLLERVGISGVSEERHAALLKEEGNKVSRRLGGALERDSRPNLFVPTSGARTRLDLEYVGGFLGGANDFYKVDFSWARYQTISDPTVLATRVRMAWTGLHSGGDFVPIDDRFKLGGANSIRGYSEKGVGPVDSLGEAIGGKVVTLVNMEFRTPISKKFWFTLFGDMGNNWGRFEEIALDKVLLSIGIGVQYLAPVGPLRLDYARRVVHPGHPRSDRLHLSILFSF